MDSVQYDDFGSSEAFPDLRPRKSTNSINHSHTIAAEEALGKIQL